MKTTDGKFLSIAQEIAKEFPDIEFDDWYIDIMTAKLVDPKRRAGFKVMVLPNLYGDILTDEAAEFQGGPCIIPGKITRAAEWPLRFFEVGSPWLSRRG